VLGVPSSARIRPFTAAASRGSSSPAAAAGAPAGMAAVPFGARIRPFTAATHQVNDVLRRLGDT